MWESDETGVSRAISYRELLGETCKIANAMRAQGVRKGDTVAIYMPMIPELAMVMLACCPIGAVHSIVFAGFSSESLRDRIVDAQSKVWRLRMNKTMKFVHHTLFVFSCSGYFPPMNVVAARRGRTSPLKKTVDQAIARLDHIVKNVFVFKRTNNPHTPFNPKVDIDMTTVLTLMRPYCPAEVMDAEDLMFILYTSGSTGKPKGVAHTTGGYLTYVHITAKYAFDLHETDVYACVADCGWITGHSYIVYGPLSNGATTVMFESTPVYPHHGRYWDLVQQFHITQFYTAPTAIRALMGYGPDIVQTFDLSSLRILGAEGSRSTPKRGNGTLRLSVVSNA